ncbi:MAG: cell wall-binding repeat-containing protein [Lagierella massiliensis]|nr:cell wall-binding repeat-containing protein [Lagierella massiliensis]
MKRNLSRKISFAIFLVFFISILSYSNSNAAESWTRISGKDRFETSKKTSELLNSNTVVFANGWKFPDALSSINICNTKNAKLILVQGNEDYSKYIIDEGIEKVYIVGGKSSISENFEEKLIQTDVDVTRLYGEDRYITNLKTIEESGLTDVGVATGENFADALASAGFLKQNNAGLVLVPPSNEVLAEGVNVKYAFGGKSSVNVPAETVFAGASRYETATLIAEATEAKDLIFVDGKDFPDALSALNLLNLNDEDIVFAPLIKDLKTMELSDAATKICVVGGDSSVSDNSMKLALDGSYEEVVKDFDEFKVVKVVSDNTKYFIKNSSDQIVQKDRNNNGILNFNENRYILNDDNSIKTGWIKDGKHTYFSQVETGLSRGFLEQDGKIYYFDPLDYYMYSGGVRSTGEGCYWFGDDGVIKKGSRMSGYKHNIAVEWYLPTKEELDNNWLKRDYKSGRFLGQKIANYAASRDNLPFQWFGFDLNDPKGVYCVGATYSAYKENGIQIPGPNDCDVKADNGYRMVKVQFLDAPKFGGTYLETNFDKLLPGDIAYSARSKGSYNHGAIYLGKNGGRPMTAHATLAGGFIIEPYARVYSWGYHDLKTVRYVNAK